MTPKAVATAHKCSVCDLDWQKHGKKPTIEKCVELLKAEVARLRTPATKECSTVIGKPWLTTETLPNI